MTLPIPAPQSNARYWRLGASAMGVVEWGATMVDSPGKSDKSRIRDEVASARGTEVVLRVYSILV